MAKVIVITDMTFIGSGYYYIMTNLLDGLARLGHDISVAGLGYMGEPHDYPYQVIPSPALQDAISVANNISWLNRERKDVVFLVGMDIPIQMQLHETLKALNRPYVAITPMENGPLVQTWAMGLSNMNWVFFISELAKQEAQRAGVTKSDHLYIGVDTKLWHIPTDIERKQLRDGLGIEPDEVAILTVADNQERKNLWAGMNIVAKLKQRLPNKKFKYLMVTREDSQVGWRLRDLAQSEGIAREYFPFQRGLPTKDLWGLYAVSDIYLQPSKAEGLGLPVLEAMACGVLCVTTKTGALPELLHDGRGVLIPSSYSCIDVWGNSRRDFIDTDTAAEMLANIVSDRSYHIDRGFNAADMVKNAREYVEGRTWDRAIQQVDAKLKELAHATP